MLYRKYATSDYEKDGFDFSCISALYYKAFEEAYKDLIWKEYVNYLEDLRFSNGLKLSISPVMHHRVNIQAPLC